jgi:hypothetical protein
MLIGILQNFISIKLQVIIVRDNAIKPIIIKLVYFLRLTRTLSISYLFDNVVLKLYEI